VVLLGILLDRLPDARGAQADDLAASGEPGQVRVRYTAVTMGAIVALRQIMTPRLFSLASNSWVPELITLAFL
jgi:hypothetical protein